MYLHRDTSTVSGTLPSAEQSTLTSANDFEANQATNRVMNIDISVQAQTSLANASTASTSAVDYYVARWVSPKIDDTSISANTWTVEFGAQESNANANFPRNGAGACYVCAYAWKPSNGTKYGNILDGNTNADGEEAGTSQSLISFTFSGAAVNSLTAGDTVIVFELWARVTQSHASSYTQTVYFDGTTEGSTSNEAAWISTPQNLTFTSTQQNIEKTLNETVTLSDSVARLAAKTRTASDTVTISEASLTRLANKTRTASDTVIIGESATRLAAKNRALGTETVTISDQVDIVVASNVTRTLEENTAVSDSVSRLAAKTRTASDTVSIGESISRLAAKNRTIATETVTIGDSVARMKSAMRSLATETITIGENLARQCNKIRALATETITISEASLIRMCAKIRALATQTVVISDAVDKVVTPGGNNVVRTITETVNVSDSVARLCNKIRTISETVNITEQLTLVNSNVPAVIATVFQGAGAGGRKMKRLIRRSFKLFKD